MTAVSHALIGAAIAARVGSPVTTGILALLTHFVADAIPHWDLGTNWRVRPRVITGVLAIAETLVAIIVTFYIFRSYVGANILAIGIIFSLIPDWLEVPYYILLPRPPGFFYYMYKIQSILHSRLQAPVGVLTQLVVVTAFLIVGFVV